MIKSKQILPKNRTLMPNIEVTYESQKVKPGKELNFLNKITPTISGDFVISIYI